MQGTTQQGANTHVQHVVDTVEVEKPKITELTVQRKKPIIQEKINQVTRHIKIPQVQFLTKVDDMPVVVQRQVSTAQIVQKAMEVPPLQFTDTVNDIPVEAQRQISMVRTIQKTTEIPQLQCDDHVAAYPVITVASTVFPTATVPVSMGRPYPVSQVMTQEVVVPFAVPKKLDSPQVQLIDKVVNVPVTAQRQVSSAPRVQKIVETVEVPQIQYIDKIVDAPVTSPSGRQTKSTVSSKRESVRVKWTRLVKSTRQGKISICSRWRLTWRQVAHTSRPRQKRSESWIGPKICEKSAVWSSSWCVGKGSST